MDVPPTSGSPDRPIQISWRDTALDAFRPAGLAGATVLAAGALSASARRQGTRMHQRKIPSSGEMLPVVGCGTWRTFDVGRRPEERAPLAEVLQRPVRGRWLGDRHLADVWRGRGRGRRPAGRRSGRATRPSSPPRCGRRAATAASSQMTRSLSLLKTDHVELMQIHNLLDWRAPSANPAHLEGRQAHPLSRHHALHAERPRRAGSGDARREVGLRAAQLRARRPRRRTHACCRWRPSAASPCWSTSRSAAAGLCASFWPRKLPDWAGEIGCTSWAQLLLKFVLANPAVTCVIPGTGKPEHMRDNVQAGVGRLSRRRDAEEDGR